MSVGTTLFPLSVEYNIVIRVGDAGFKQNTLSMFEHPNEKWNNQCWPEGEHRAAFTSNNRLAGPDMSLHVCPCIYFVYLAVPTIQEENTLDEKGKVR